MLSLLGHVIRYMNLETNDYAVPYDELDLRKFIEILWAEKWFLFGVTAVFAVGSIIYALNQPNIYRSEATLVPASGVQVEGVSGIAGQFGGLAALAGINLDSGGIDKTTLSLEVLKSREFIGKLISTHNLLMPLMAVEGWDADSNKLIINENIYDREAGHWIAGSESDKDVRPSLQKAYKVFVGKLSVSRDKKTSVVKIGVEHYSPYIAQKWVSLLIAELNDEMKRRDIEEARRSIEYLGEQVQKTNVAEVQSVLYQLVEEQTKTLMFAEVRDEYVFNTVDPSIVPEEKIKPKRSSICILGTIIGALLAVFLVLIKRNYLQQGK